MNTVQTMLGNLRRAYIAELPARLGEIERMVIGLERRGFQEEAFNKLFREVHSLKGSGGTHGLHIVTAICHPLEDFMSTLPGAPEKADGTFADVALAYIDLLREVSALLEGDEPSFSGIERKLLLLRRRAFKPERTALIVDNSRLAVNLLTETLQKLSFRVVVLDDGYTALGRALDEPFDLLITSQEIKHMSGIALISALRLTQAANQTRTKTMLLTVNRDLKIPPNCPDFVIAKDAKLVPHLLAALENIAATAG